MHKLRALRSLLREEIYVLGGLKLSLVNLGGKWAIYQGVGGGLWPVEDAAYFGTLEEAQAFAEKLFSEFQEPLTRREIISHFNAKWMRREEQSSALFTFREHLLSGNYRAARKVAKRFSSYTWEAIPDKVRYHLKLS